MRTPVLKVTANQTVKEDMKIGLRFAFAIYFGFIIYSAAVFFLGQSGLSAFAKLSRHRESLETNIGELGTIGEELKRSRDELLQDASEIVLLSRSLGYYASGEVRVIVPDSSQTGLSHTLGRMMRSYTSSDGNNSLFRAVAFVFALGAFILAFLIIGQPRDHSFQR